MADALFDGPRFDVHAMPAGAAKFTFLAVDSWGGAGSTAGVAVAYFTGEDFVLVSVGRAPFMVLYEERKAFIAGLVESIPRTAPEARGSTLVVLVMSGGDWLESSVLSKAAKDAALAMALKFFHDVVAARDPKTGYDGVAASSEKLIEMKDTVVEVLGPKGPGLWFHPGLTSPGGNPETAEADLEELRAHMAHLPPKGTPAFACDVVMALSLLLHEGRRVVAQ